MFRYLLQNHQLRGTHTCQQVGPILRTLHCQCSRQADKPSPPPDDRSADMARGRTNNNMPRASPSFEMQQTSEDQGRKTMGGDERGTRRRRTYRPICTTTHNNVGRIETGNILAAARQDMAPQLPASTLLDDVSAVVRDKDHAFPMTLFGYVFRQGSCPPKRPPRNILEDRPLFTGFAILLPTR